MTTFLSNTLDGLKLVYQGNNTISGTTVELIKSTKSMSIDAVGSDASLNVSGGHYSTIAGVVNIAGGTLTLNGGTINLSRSSSKPLLNFTTVTVNNCELHLMDTTSGKAYPLAEGSSLNIANNSNVTMESSSYVTLGGTMKNTFDAFSSSFALTVDGNSFVNVINTCTCSCYSRKGGICVKVVLV